MVEAIRHAQAAGDWAHAARLLADNYVGLVFDGRKATLRALLDAFPAGAPEDDAELALAFATGRLYDGLLDESAAHIAVAERLAATVPDGRAGGCSTCGWPARGSGSRVSAAISPPRGRRCGRSKRGPRTRSRAATTIARRP